MQSATEDRRQTAARRAMDSEDLNEEARQRCALLEFPDSDRRVILHINGAITTGEIDANVRKLALDLKCGVQLGWDIQHCREEVTKVFVTFTAASERVVKLASILFDGKPVRVHRLEPKAERKRAAGAA